MTVVKDESKASFAIATTPQCTGKHFSFLWIAPLTLDTYFIMLSIKQVFFSLWYDSTKDWTPVSRAMVEHFTNKTYIYTHTHTHTYIYIYIYYRQPNRLRLYNTPIIFLIGGTKDRTKSDDKAPILGF